MTAKIKAKLIVTAMLLMLTGPFAYAAAPAPSAAPATPVTAEPNPVSNPMLAEFIKAGAKVYYLGEHAGLQGWFITKNNQVQIAYASPDNQDVVIGVLFDGQGNSITSQQMKTLYDNNKEIDAFFNNLNNQQLPMQEMPVQVGRNSSPSSPSTFFPAQTSPGEQLMQALQNAAGVDVGATTAPKLTMVIDPNCPHCHATWQAIRAAVFGGKLQVRLVPIDAQGNPDSQRGAAQLLHTANPLDAWDKYVGGDKSQLAGNPDTATLAAIQQNHVLTDAWRIQTTPYLVYRGKDGQVKIVQGEPEHSDAILNDIGP